MFYVSCVIALVSRLAASSLSYDHPPLLFFIDTATTEIYTLSLHDALPISPLLRFRTRDHVRVRTSPCPCGRTGTRSEEHTSELQSHSDLVCRLLLEKKKTNE